MRRLSPPVSMIVRSPSSCSSARTPAASGTRLVGQADPSQRARLSGQGDRRADGFLGLTQFVVKRGLAKADFVDVSVTAQVILHRAYLTQHGFSGMAR